jgi:opacity protein-like surface antigen
MKKLLIISAILTSFTSNVFAKTEGHYLGLNILQSNVKHEYEVDGTKVANYPKFDDSTVGFGVDYKYAINLNGIFIAPGVFYDHISTEAKDDDNDSVNTNFRYGIKADIGYDFTESLSAYFSVGAAVLNYEMDWQNSLGLKKSGNAISGIVGVGAKYEINENLALKAEFDYQNAEIEGVVADTGRRWDTQAQISTIKFGAAYKF